MYILGIDVGGTFTDLVAVEPRSGDVRTAKLPSRAGKVGEVVRAGIREMGLTESAINRVTHGTTVATNALLERRGALTALVTTRGFRDTIQIGRGRRLAEGGMFDLRFRRPPPLVARELRLEVNERTRANGDAIAAMSQDDLAAAARTIAAHGAQAVAVCFLHSYKNPAHEDAAATFLRAQLGDGVFVTTSAAVNPQFREFERFSTAVANAYVGPALHRYLQTLDEQKGGVAHAQSVYIMGSTGGVMDFDTARAFPVRTILSGPAGGVTAAQYLGKTIGIDNLILCDMGGTSTDVSLLKGDRLLYANETIISGVPIRAAQLEINTIGAGAGSIVWLDVDGSLNVGPQSAGGFPGPACYGNGGEAPTVTDANVVLDRIAGGTLLGGCVAVNADLSRRVFASIRDGIGVASIEDAAGGALEILVARTVRAIREVSLERGFDPRDFALVAFGGAGPMHCTDIADGLGIRTVVVPNHPGNFSAMGLVVANVRRDESATYLATMSSLDDADLRSRLHEIGARIRAHLLRDEVVPETIRLACFLEMRCAGQTHEILVPLSGDPQSVGPGEINRAFEAIYEERYGRQPEPGFEREIINLRVLGEGQVEAFPASVWRRAGGQGAGAGNVRAAWFGGRRLATTILDRKTLPAGLELQGPAIIEESSATTVVPPGWKGVVHETGHLILTRSEEQRA